MKSEKGITLVALILTIVILVILMGISVNSGIESLNDTRLQGFYTELEIIQKRVDDIASTNEAYVNKNGNTIYIKTAGSTITSSQKNVLQNILNSKSISVGTTNFRYFTIQELENILDLSNMNYDVFIDFENRIVVAEKGIKIGQTTYYMLENSTYFVTQNENKNIGDIEQLNYTVSEYGEDKYKINIVPKNIIGDLNGTGYVKYKKTTTKYWETSNNTEIIIEPNIEYNIIYTDSNNNSIQKTIIVKISNDSIFTVSEV